MSPDGRYIVYNLFTDGPVDAAGYLRDLQTGTVVRLPGLTLDFSSAAFSADDRLLAYQQFYTHGSIEAVYDIAAGQVDATLAIFEREWHLPFISSGGRYVAYTASTDPIVHGPSAVYRYDRSSRRSERVGGVVAGWLGEAEGISGDGNLVLVGTSQPLLPADTNGTTDVYSRDMRTGQTRLVSATPTGHAGNGWSAATALTPDGRYVLFRSEANDLVPGDTNNTGDAFVRDLHTGRTQRVDVSSDGVQARFSAQPVAPSADGRYALFTSTAGNLVPGDTNGMADVFAHDLRTGRTWRVSASSTGAQANAACYGQGLTADGRYALFTSTATDLSTPPTLTGGRYLYRADLHTGIVTRLNTAPSA